MTRHLLFFSALFFMVSSLAWAQTEVPLKFSRDLPKNLFSAPTAVLVTYTTNRETTPAEDAQKISELSTQLLTDNQQLGLQLLHFAGKNALEQPTQKQRLLNQYDSLKIENLLFLEVNEIVGMGAQGSYVFKLTAFNHTPALMAPKQKAYLITGESYGVLLQNFQNTVQNYPKAYFHKGPERVPLKPALTTEPDPVPTASEQANSTTLKPLTYPLIRLTIEDQDRSNGGPTRNFYYYLGASQQEKNAGFFGQHLRQDINPSREALNELNKYRSYKIAYIAERVVFVSAVMLYANEVLKGDDYAYFNDRQKVYIGVAAGSLLLNLFIARNTNEHFHRAVDEYNAFATMRNQTGLRRFKPDNIGFGTVCDRKLVPGLSLHWRLR